MLSQSTVSTCQQLGQAALLRGGGVGWGGGGLEWLLPVTVGGDVPAVWRELGRKAQERAEK